MSVKYLKVKLKSLAAEAKIIRLEETRSRGGIRNGLHEHRVGIVRFESRHTHLAYAFLRGKEYEQVEKTCKTPPDWRRVYKMVKKYGSGWDEDGRRIEPPTEEEVTAWRQTSKT